MLLNEMQYNRSKKMFKKYDIACTKKEVTHEATEVFHVDA